MSTGWMHRADAWWHARSSAISSSPGARSSPPGCLVAMEACSSAHHWARKLRALGLDTRLIAANFVTPYRMEGKSGKNDATDAAAICEAASRPGMRFVPVKTCEQQGVMSLHRVREGLEGRAHRVHQPDPRRVDGVRPGVWQESQSVARSAGRRDRRCNQRTQHDGSPRRCSGRSSTGASWTQHMQWCDRQVGQHVRGSPEAKRAAKVIGIGEIGASALTAGVGDFTQFKSGHQFGAWLGVVPRQASSGGKIRLGRITKRGDDYLRTLLIQGAKAAVMSADKRDDPTSRWLAQLTARVGWQKACVAMANKNARILWAVMTREEGFDSKHVSVKPQAKQSPATRRGSTAQLRRLRGLNAVTQSRQPINPTTKSDSFHPRRALEDAFDRSDRQLVNSINRARRQSCPTPYREWSPAERFVSGSAPTGATRPFVDVQSVLCRTAASMPHVLHKTH